MGKPEPEQTFRWEVTSPKLHPHN